MTYDTNKHTNESKKKILTQMNINMIKEQNLYGNASAVICKILQNLKRTHQLIPNFETQNEVEGSKKNLSCYLSFNVN
jgi:hypothetical protein